MLENLKKDLKKVSNTEKAKILQKFFKTWPGEYWEWDIFLWITIPEIRKISKNYLNLSYAEIEKLLKSQIHEYRFIALCILRYNFEKAKDIKNQEEIIKFVHKNLKSINNWDLVDTFIPYVFGKYYFDKNKDFVFEFAKSDDLWLRRIAILTHFYDIKQGSFSQLLKICEQLLTDKHDLIHKACGWMLREVGKKDEKVLLDFLDKYYKKMPRTMLRYSLERLSDEKRKFYMKKD